MSSMSDPGLRPIVAVSGIFLDVAACYAIRALMPMVAGEAEEPWCVTMARPLTDRSANVAKVDVPLPSRFRDAFRRIVEARNQQGGQRRLFPRDLHEEAISLFVQRTEAGEDLLLMAAPVGISRTTLWMDAALKAKVDELALARGVTRSAVVLSAFHYFQRQLAEPAKAAAA